MKINKSLTDLKRRLTNIGYRVYFVNGKVKLFKPTWVGNGCNTITYREAYRRAKGGGGDGKSVRVWANPLKHLTKRKIRTKVRDQIKKLNEDVYCRKQDIADPWKWD